MPAAPGNRPPADRPRFTGRAAVLAVVLCAIALSLAYPVREYIAQGRQIDQLEFQHRQLVAQFNRLEAEQKQLSTRQYIERLARDELHLCLPAQTCYVLIGTHPPRAGRTAAQTPPAPWYDRLWASVRQAGQGSAR